MSIEEKAPLARVTQTVSKGLYSVPEGTSKEPIVGVDNAEGSSVGSRVDIANNGVDLTGGLGQQNKDSVIKVVEGFESIVQRKSSGTPKKAVSYTHLTLPTKRIV